jgi:hypothetical protein
LARRAASAARVLLPPLAAGAAAAIPVINSTIKAMNARWEPAGDDGIISTRGWDVLTSHTPLIGQYSEAGLVLRGQIMHSPGPMLYWLLALPARFGDVQSLALTMGVVNSLAIVGCVILSRRRGGLPLMFAAAIGIALMCQSLPTEAMHDVWNPAAGLFPFLLLIFVCWSLACGEKRLLPLAALLASFVVQTHLMYAAPTAVLLAVGCGALLIEASPRAGALLPRRRRSSRLSTAPEQVHPEGRLWPWAAAALVVLALCWWPPVLDEIEHSPGNLTVIVRTAEHHGRTLGVGVGWNAIARSVGVRPWWLYVPASEWERKADVRAAPSTLARDSTIAILALLAVVGVLAALARRRDLATATLIGLGLCLAIGLEAASNPATTLLAETLGYTMWWGSELGLWVWLMLAWGLWLGLAAIARRARPTLRDRDSARLRALARSWLRPAAVGLASVACLAGTAATAFAVAGTAKPDSHAYEYGSIAALGAGITRAIPPGRVIDYRFGPLDLGTQPMEPAIRFLLVRHRERVLAPGSLPRLGSYYELYRRRYQWIVDVRDGTRPVAPDMRLVARVRFRSPWGAEVVSAWVQRVGATHLSGLPVRHRKGHPDK